MIIVVIHWRIRPGDVHRNAFLREWAETLTINERDHLVGEYLSRPMTSEEAGFECGLLGLPRTDQFESFFNIALWDDFESFRREVIDPHAGSPKEPRPFEYGYRQRLALKPQLWRAGLSKPPMEDGLADPSR